MRTWAKTGHVTSKEINKEIWWPVALYGKTIILTFVRKRRTDSEVSEWSVTRAHTALARP